MKSLETKDLLKISEVASLSGTNLTTVKYYVKEGLIDIACKTGKNMAWYFPESVERVKLIRVLQSEKYYPLSVIKRILRDGVDAEEVKLLDVINKADESDYYETLSLGEAAQEAGLKLRKAEILVTAGLIKPTREGRVRLCTRGELRMMKLAKRRLDAGIPLSQTVKVFELYEKQLQDSTRCDIESLISDCMLKKTLSTEDIVKIITVSDETLDDYIGMRRYALNASMGADFIAKTELMFTRLKGFALGLYRVLEGENRKSGAALVKSMLEGEKTGEAIVDCYGELLSLTGQGIARALSVLHRAGVCLSQASAFGGEERDFVKGALRLGWQSFAPKELGINPESAADEFTAVFGNSDIAKTVLRLRDELQSEEIIKED